MNTLYEEVVRREALRNQKLVGYAGGLGRCLDGVWWVLGGQRERGRQIRTAIMRNAQQPQ